MIANHQQRQALKQSKLERRADLRCRKGKKSEQIILNRQPADGAISANCRTRRGPRHIDFRRNVTGNRELSNFFFEIFVRRRGGSCSGRASNGMQPRFGVRGHHHHFFPGALSDPQQAAPLVEGWQSSSRRHDWASPTLPVPQHQ